MLVFLFQIYQHQPQRRQAQNRDLAAVSLLQKWGRGDLQLADFSSLTWAFFLCYTFSLSSTFSLSFI
jgi:hypothetical protein